MTVTPLYTAAELDSEIAQAKTDLAAARKVLSYQVGLGGSSRQIQRNRVDELQKHLEWLQQQRVSLEIGHGPQIIQGRVPRG
jgi:hypothetical protein